MNVIRFHNKDWIDIGKMARDWRVNHHVKQSEVGELLGVGQTAISAFETGISHAGDTFLWYLNHGAYDCLIVDKEDLEYWEV